MLKHCSCSDKSILFFKAYLWVGHGGRFRRETQTSLFQTQAPCLSANLWSRLRAGCFLFQANQTSESGSEGSLEGSCSQCQIVVEKKNIPKCSAVNFIRFIIKLWRTVNTNRRPNFRNTLQFTSTHLSIPSPF